MSCVSLFPHLPSILISLVWVLLCFFHGTAVVSTQSLRGFSTYTNMLVCSPPNTQQTQPDVVDDGHRSNADWLKGGAGQARHSSMHHKCVRYKNTLKMKNTAWEAQMLAVVVVVFFLMLELCSSLQLVDGPTTAQVRVACRQIVCGTAPWWQWTVTTCRNSLQRCP